MTVAAWEATYEAVIPSFAFDIVRIFVQWQLNKTIELKTVYTSSLSQQLISNCKQFETQVLWPPAKNMDFHVWIYDLSQWESDSYDNRLTDHLKSSISL